MKNIRWIFLFSLVAVLSCNKDSDSDLDPNDLDGDGVTNQQEVADNTDPEDPCSLNLSSQVSANVSSAWKMMDCDGDGVSNEQELADQTGLLDANGFDLCDFVEANQDPTQVTQLWQSYDCDQDGVLNGVELLDDNTDINDPCSLILTSQSSTPDSWLALDCDGDRVSNGDEIASGTDLFDPDDYPGAGTKLLYATTFGTRYDFINDGNLFDKVTNANNEVSADYDYDGQNRLTQVFRASSSSQGNFDIRFSYNGTDITEINFTRGTSSTIYDVTYDGLKIHVNEQGVSLPNGINQRSYTFDASGRVLYSEFYRSIGGSSFVYTRTDFTYNGPNNFDLTNTVLETQYYDSNTDTFSSTQGTNDYVRESFSYSHEASVKNPAFNASQSVYVHSILVPEILGFPWYMRYSFLSENYVKSASRLTESAAGSTSNNETYGFYVVQSNQYPRFAYRESLGTETPVEFFYTE